MTVHEFLNVVAILESIDKVPGMPRGKQKETDWNRMMSLPVSRQQVFRNDPLRFLQRADDATRAAIWTEVERRLKA